jgi:hypothetical protein
MAETRDRTLPPHVTTPLLSLVTEQALEEDYRSVAARRARDGAVPEPPRTRLVAAATVVVFGVLVSVAAVQNSRNAEVDDAGRATLVARITEAKGDLEDRRARIADLTVTTAPWPSRSPRSPPAGSRPSRGCAGSRSPPATTR